MTIVREQAARDLAMMTRRDHLLLVVSSYAFAVVAYWHFLYIFDNRMPTLYQYQRDLLAGHAEWVADQNRVLAPLCILGFQKLFGMTYESAYQHFMLTIFVVQNLCAALLFKRCYLSLGQSMVGLLLVTTLPLALMSIWWFPWTNLEFTLVLLMFIVDASDLRGGARAVLYGCVFAAWALTKETCFLLPVWLALRYGLPALQHRRWKVLFQTGAICAAMIILAAGVIAGLRRWLWVSGINPNYPNGMPFNTPTVLAGTHIFSLGSNNYKALIRTYRAFLEFRSPWPLWNNGHFVDWSVGMIDLLVALGIVIGCTVWAVSKGSSRLIALALTALIYVLVLFAAINPLEGDKLMPALAVGAYAYALLARPQREVVTRPHQLIAA